jgi:hypothetical protein
MVIEVMVVKLLNPLKAISVTGKPFTVAGIMISEAIALPLDTEISKPLFMGTKDKPGETSGNP